MSHLHAVILLYLILVLMCDFSNTIFCGCRRVEILTSWSKASALNGSFWNRSHTPLVGKRRLFGVHDFRCLLLACLFWRQDSYVPRVQIQQDGALRLREAPIIEPCHARFRFLAVLLSSFFLLAI